MLKRILLAVVVAGFCSTGAFAQDDIFLTFGQGANESESMVGLDQIGESGSVFLYATSGVDFLAFNVDAISSDNGVAEIVGATIFNPEVQAGFSTVNRFTNAQDGAAPGDDIVLGAASVDENGLLGLVGVGAFNGDLGVLAAAGAADSTFDAALNAFLIAEINYDIVGQGTTEFSLQTTDISFLVSTSPEEVFLTPSLGTGTLVVGVPEPSTVGLLALGLVGFVARRRR